MPAIMAQTAQKKTWKNGSPRMRKYTLLRLQGVPIQKAYKLAGYRGLRSTKAAYRVEERAQKRDDMSFRTLESGKITNRVLLGLGLAAMEKIFDDYLNNRPEANPRAVAKLLKMQHDRIYPVPKRVSARSRRRSLHFARDVKLEQDCAEFLRSRRA